MIALEAMDAQHSLVQVSPAKRITAHRGDRISGHEEVHGNLMWPARVAIKEHLGATPVELVRSLRRPNPETNQRSDDFSAYLYCQSSKPAVAKAGQTVPRGHTTLIEASARRRRRGIEQPEPTDIVAGCLEAAGDLIGEHAAQGVPGQEVRSLWL